MLNPGGVFESIEVWRRGEDGLVRYRCLRNLLTGTYSVQSSDLFRPEHRDALDQQFLELLAEDDPEIRSGGFPTLLEAIEAHERALQSGG